MTAEQRAKALIEELPYTKKTTGGVAGFEKKLVLAIKEAMRDQRHACADALSEVLSTGDKAIIMSQAHQAVFNADVK